MQDDDEDADSEVESPPEPEEGGGDPLDDEALGQSEIDDLFGISADEEPPVEGIYALLNSTQVPHRRMPVLDACFDRMVQTLSKSLRSFTSGDVELSLVDTRSVRFGNYIGGVPLPALISIFEVVEWTDHGLINIDSALIYAMIDVMLGGRQATPSLAVETRSFTAIEVKLIERLIMLILKEMTSAFKPVTDVEFQLERMEANPSLVEIASPPSLAVLFSIDVRLGERGGRIEILIPYATLEPMSDVLDQMFTGEKSGHDSIWESHLAGQMIQSDAELEVTFGDQMMPLGKILDLQVGSTLTLRNKPEDPVMLRCGNIALMHADVGRIGDIMAIRIANWCDGARRRAPKKGCRLG